MFDDGHAEDVAANEGEYTTESRIADVKTHLRIIANLLDSHQRGEQIAFKGITFPPPSDADLFATVAEYADRIRRTCESYQTPVGVRSKPGIDSVGDAETL